MSTRIVMYRTPLADPQGFSLRGDGPHPREAGAAEYLYHEREVDDAGHEALFVRHAPGKDVLYRKATRWEAGRRVGEEEYFAETGATVIHEILRTGDEETERVLFDGELDSTIVRTFRPDGTLSVEKVLDASGELTSLTEHDGAGRVVHQTDPRSEQLFRYDPSGEIAEVVTIADGERTVESTVFESGVPVGAIVTRDGQEIGRRTIAREPRRRVEEETRAGRVVLRRVEDLDAAGRTLSLEESSERGDGSLVETRRAQEWSDDGRLLASTVEAWIRVPGAGRMKAAFGRREMTYDGEGRIAELLLQDTRDEELEDDSYYRFEYAPGSLPTSIPVRILKT
jgi:YD repeat-containing protein